MPGLSTYFGSIFVLPPAQIYNGFKEIMSEDGNRSIARVYYSINTSDSKSGVEIIWDGETNATALFLSGQGFMDFRTDGNSIPNNAGTPTGDVLLSTKNFASGDNYTIIVEFR